MKRLVLLLLILASICSAQVEHGGLRIPGDEAVQVMKSSAWTPIKIPGLIFFGTTDTYVSNPGGVDTWQSMYGSVTMVQATETWKPTITPIGLLFDGIDDALIGNASVASSATPLGCSIVLVASYSTSVSNYATSVFFYSIGQGRRLVAYLSNNLGFFIAPSAELAAITSYASVSGTMRRMVYKFNKLASLSAVIDNTSYVCNTAHIMAGDFIGPVIGKDPPLVSTIMKQHMKVLAVYNHPLTDYEISKLDEWLRENNLL